jgi:SPP1 gp7 family putative phage head morphogenesis protein
MSKIKNLTKDKNYRRSTVIVPAVGFPYRASSIYRISLQNMIQVMSNSIRDNVIPVLEDREEVFIKDADESDEKQQKRDLISLQNQIDQLIQDAASGFLNIDIFSANLARRHANLVDQMHAMSFQSTFDRALGVDVNQALQDEKLKGIIDKHIKENVKLIKSIPKDYFNKVNKIMQESLAKGTSVSSIKRQLFTEGLNVKQTGLLGITKRRAKLIARDQTGKLNGQVNRARQLHLGIDEYIWRDRGDNRVRPLHVDLNGQKFSWNGEPRPPEDLDPGQPIQCRCIAEAVVIL